MVIPGGLCRPKDGPIRRLDLELRGDQIEIRKLVPPGDAPDGTL
jgi:hypothetical protein